MPNSPTAPTIGDLFQSDPGQWGLRGDPYLWQELRQTFAQTALPQSATDLAALLDAAFLSLTGHALADAQNLRIDRYAKENGGMSNGMIAGEFWRTKAMPILLARYEQKTSTDG